MPEKVANITIATYNRLECTRECIRTLLERTHLPYKLVVVDNGSADGTPDYLLDLYRQKIIHKLALLERNMGVACGYNIGWSLLPADYYLKIDNDVVFLRDDWLNKLTFYADRFPDAAMLGFHCNTTGIRREEVADDVLHYMSHIGELTFIRGDIFQRLGYWCEDYGFYGEEDSDYGARARLAGYVNLAICEREKPYVAFSDVSKNPDRENYNQWKKEVREQQKLFMFTLNDTLYKSKLRNLKMDRMYLPRLEDTKCTVSVDREYIKHVAALSKKYGPIMEAIRDSEAFRQINHALSFDAWL
ncbi:MAG: glycosyltransferase [Desulfovibrionaceae bacterium]|nr:glycosyltransferase [Desulfovibrionaceae bacterium]MBF0514805.1 glycosyltransferase [Desulfovibrionaceae bacterium]